MTSVVQSSAKEISLFFIRYQNRAINNLAQHGLAVRGSCLTPHLSQTIAFVAGAG